MTVLRRRSLCIFLIAWTLATACNGVTKQQCSDAADYLNPVVWAMQRSSFDIGDSLSMMDNEANCRTREAYAKQLQGIRANLGAYTFTSKVLRSLISEWVVALDDHIDALFADADACRELQPQLDSVNETGRQLRHRYELILKACKQPIPSR